MRPPEIFFQNVMPWLAITAMAAKARSQRPISDSDAAGIVPRNNGARERKEEMEEFIKGSKFTVHGSRFISYLYRLTPRELSIHIGAEF